MYAMFTKKQSKNVRCAREHILRFLINIRINKFNKKGERLSREKK